MLVEIKGGGLGRKKKGVVEMAAALGEDDMGPASNHRPSAQILFDIPYATNTFVFLDEDPTLMKETEKGEPGSFLITDLGGLPGI